MIVSDAHFLDKLKEAEKKNERWLIITNNETNQTNHYSLSSSISENDMKDFLEEKLSKEEKEHPEVIVEIIGVGKIQRIHKALVQYCLVKTGTGVEMGEHYISHKLITRSMRQKVQKKIAELHERIFV